MTCWTFKDLTKTWDSLEGPTKVSFLPTTAQYSLIATDLLTYLLHGAESFLRSWLVLQLIKKFPAFYGTRKFIIVLTRASHWQCYQLDRSKFFKGNNEIRESFLKICAYEIENCFAKTVGNKVVEFGIFREGEIYVL